MPLLLPKGLAPNYASKLLCSPLDKNSCLILGMFSSSAKINKIMFKISITGIRSPTKKNIYLAGFYSGFHLASIILWKRSEAKTISVVKNGNGSAIMKSLIWETQFCVPFSCTIALLICIQKKEMKRICNCIFKASNWRAKKNEIEKCTTVFMTW